MRHPALWGALTLSCVIAMTAAAQDTGEPARAKSISWWNPFGLWKSSQPAAKPPLPPTKRRAVSKSPAEIRAKEEADWHRRQAVCDRLRNIALRTGDMSLLRKAELLNDRATATFRERISGLSSGGDSDAPKPWSKDNPVQRKAIAPLDSGEKEEP